MSALALASCTFLYEPSRYWADGGVDAGSPDLDAYVPPGADADLDAFTPPPDAWSPDAYVPPGADADLDALMPADASAPDAFVPPDAWSAPVCPASDSLALPGCTHVNGLGYCDPSTGAPRFMSSAMADEILPGARHELGLLGNANQVADAAPDHIVDFELAREGNRLVAVWLDDTTREVRRREYTVGAAGLTASAETSAAFGDMGSRGTDVSMNRADVDDVVVAYVNGDVAAYGDCPSSAFGASCTEIGTATGGTGVTRVLVAHAGSTVVGAFIGLQSSSSGFYTEVVDTARPTPTYFFGVVPSFLELRSTSGGFVYTAGAADGSDRVVSATTAASRGLGGNMPRLTRNDDAPNDYRLSRARLGATDVTIDSAFVTRADADGSLDCGGGGCSTFGEGSSERHIANTYPELRDWSYDIVDDAYRVVTVLVGDFSGTEVAIATWDLRLGTVGETLAPVVVGSGRLTPTGSGRAIRTVVTRTTSSLEVFVLTLVTLGDGASARDRLYLSGFRLLACGP